MRKILITGAAGYIGSHTLVLMLEQGYDIIVLDNFSNSSPDVYDRVAAITGKVPKWIDIDLCNRDVLDNFWSQNSDIDSVIHFAAHKAVGESVTNPLKYYSNNVGGVVSLIEIGLKYGLTNVVFSSSCTVYGQPDNLPVTEQTPRAEAESPYGNTKKICEDILCDVVNSSARLKVISLRYFNPIGAHPSCILGELPRGVPNNLVPYITQTAAGIRNELKIFGNDYNTPDGTCIRDFIDINDLARAHIVALEYLDNKPECAVYEVFNIGTGHGVSVKKLIDTFIDTTGVVIPYSYAERRLGDIEKIWADTALANKVLGWRADTPLEQTLLNAWKWEKYIRGL